MFYVFLIIIIVLIFIIFFQFKRINSLMCIIFNYEKIIDDQGQKNHEYNNQLLVLMGYIDNKSKLKEYLQTIIDDHKVGQNYEIRQLTNLPDGGIKNMFYYKVCKMKKLSIKYDLYITDEVKEVIESLNIKDYKDLTKLLGVFLDNSIDSSKESIKKEISIDMKIEDNYLEISISNSYDEISFDKIGKKGFTTKGYGHGYGLMIVKEIIRNNNKIELVTETENDTFIQTILFDLG